VWTFGVSSYKIHSASHNTRSALIATAKKQSKKLNECKEI
jgi:hypothetical protein